MLIVAESSNGRTTVSGTVYLGSSPGSAAMCKKLLFLVHPLVSRTTVSGTVYLGSPCLAEATAKAGVLVGQQCAQTFNVIIGIWKNLKNIGY